MTGQALTATIFSTQNILQPHKLKELAVQFPFFPEHIYLFTSNLGKVCILSKKAFLSSAQAVNQNLKVEKKDSWLISLPLFHAAGLSILARSFCGGFSSRKSSSPLWNTKAFQKKLQEQKITLCSLVPAQVYDLVQNNLKAPKQLRAVLVGGSALSPFLHKKARLLGWPILICYGLTEACSQIACGSLESLHQKASAKMKFLNHIKIKKSSAHIKIKSESLLTAYFDLKLKEIYDPKDSQGWLKLQDEILLTKDSLVVKGRKDEEIKILGERVSLQKLSFLLETLTQNVLGEYQLAAIPNVRQGSKLVLMSTLFDIHKLLFFTKQFNKKVLPFEKIHSIYCVSEIQKNQLFKVRQENLKKQISL